MAEQVQEQEKSTDTGNPFINAVLKYFSQELIMEGMRARKSQRGLMTNSSPTDEFGEEECLKQWDAFAKESAMSLINYIRNVKNQELNAEIETFVRRVAPEELFK